MRQSRHMRGMGMSQRDSGMHLSAYGVLLLLLASLAAVIYMAGGLRRSSRIAALAAPRPEVEAPPLAEPAGEAVQPFRAASRSAESS